MISHLVFTLIKSLTNNMRKDSSVIWLTSFSQLFKLSIIIVVKKEKGFAALHLVLIKFRI